MGKSEIAFIKQSLLITKDWDAFQAIMIKYRVIANRIKREKYD